jgi:hypothetical protein
MQVCCVTARKPVLQGAFQPSLILPTVTHFRSGGSVSNQWRFDAIIFWEVDG